MTDSITTPASEVEHLRSELGACLSAARGHTDGDGPPEWTTYSEVLDLARAHRALQDAVAADPAPMLRAAIARLAARVVDPAQLPALADALDAVHRSTFGVGSRPAGLESGAPLREGADLERVESIAILWRARADKLAAIVDDIDTIAGDDPTPDLRPALRNLLERARTIVTVAGNGATVWR